MTPDMLQTVLFFGGGLVGSACRAAIAPDQVTFSKKSVVDLIIGGLVGVIYPATGAPMLGANVIVQASFVAVLSYAGSGLIQDVLARAGIGPGTPKP